MMYLFVKIYLSLREFIICNLNILKKKWWENDSFTLTGTAALNDSRIVKKELGKRKMSKEFWKSNYCHPGAKIFFKSEAKAIRIKFKISSCMHIKYTTLNGTSGIDIYENIGSKRIWRGCYTPRTLFSNHIAVTLKPSAYKVQFEIIFPSFARVLDFKVKAIDGKIYKERKIFSYKFVFYGSSITQGCASSRPALAYPNILGEMFNAEIYNFGFSSAAYGEIEVADYITQIPMDILVMEYDHNSTVEELRKSHYLFYKQIRKKSSAPIIMISRMSGGISNTLEEQRERNAIIRRTYTKALEDGDKRIFYICGENLVGNKKRENFFTDDRHPNDYGMFILAEAVSEKIKEVLHI